MLWSGKDACGMLVQQAPFEEVVLVTEVVGDSSYCVVTEGTDPVTGLRHRCVWIFEAAAGAVHRVLRTSLVIS